MGGGDDSTATTVAGVDAQSRQVTTDDNNDNNNNSQDEQQTTEIVRQRSLEIIQSASLENPFHSSDPALDPTSPQFSPKAWLRALLTTSSQEPEKYPRHNVGLSFRDLSVGGSKGGLTFQNDILTWPSKFPMLLFDLLSNRNAGMPILTDFDGLVKSGEMLLVLGRPGR